MADIDPQLVEKYQLMLEEQPDSKVFAPLSELYRKMGLLAEAKDVCEKGLQLHPRFAGGHLALAKTLMDMGETSKAQKSLEQATSIDPENILAQSLLADTFLKLRESKKALRAFKMVLFLNPNDSKAQKAVKKLESLTADEFDEDVFAMKPLASAVEEWKQQQESLPEIAPQSGNSSPSKQHDYTLERLTSLADAFLVRNDLAKVEEALDEAERYFGDHPEIVRRRKILQAQELEEETIVDPPPSRDKQILDDKIQFLQNLLQSL